MAPSAGMQRCRPGLEIGDQMQSCVWSSLAKLLPTSVCGILLWADQPADGKKATAFCTVVFWKYY